MFQCRQVVRSFANNKSTPTVTPLELFFDLVFVFALTQVTAFMADELSWHGILRGALVLILLWWAWTGYAWLANLASALRSGLSS
jgi:low temperature requirement protein LtrA